MSDRLIRDLQKRLYSIRERSEGVLAAFRSSPTYTVHNTEGKIPDYRYFVYPYKNFSETDPQDEQFIAEQLAAMIGADAECLVTFEADGIGIGKLISVLVNKPLIVCKPFHYHQKVFSFIQKTGYFSRTLYCPNFVLSKKIALIDCLVSTGGTVQGFLEAAKGANPDMMVEGVYTVANKLNYHRKEQVLFSGTKYKSLFDVLVGASGSVEAVVSDDFREAYWSTVNVLVMSAAERLAKRSDHSRNAFEVGSIILDNRTLEVVGWGHKEEILHAEQVAFVLAEKYGMEGQDLTLYTTLEPCVKRTIPDQVPCSRSILDCQGISWVVIGCRDALDEDNFNRGIELLLGARKHIVVFDHHASVPINWTDDLSRRRGFSDSVEIDWDAIASRYRKTVDNEYILEPTLIRLAHEEVLTGKTVVELGCGAGRIAFELSKEAASVIGTDISPQFVDIAQKTYKNGNLRYTVADATDMRDVVSDGSADVVVSNLMFLVVASFDDIQDMFSEAFRMLKSGGVFVFSNSHPCFEHRSLPGIKRVETKNGYDYFRRDDTYDVTLLDMNGHPTVSFNYYHRALGEILRLLLRSGFRLECLMEPEPDDALLEKFPQLKIEREFSPFMIIKMRKEE